MRKNLLLLLCLIVAPVSAQVKADWERMFEQFSEFDDLENDDAELRYERFNDLAENPIDLNSATPEQLRQFPFLTEKQVEDISAYLYQYGPMRSLGELALIESLDAERRQMLLCFVTLRDEAPGDTLPSLRSALKWGRSELIGTLKVPFYERRGDENGYLGYPYKHWFRYIYRYRQQLRVGLIGSQDAGEPWFAGRNSAGYDYYSFFAELHDVGRLRSLVVGRYRLRFGRGLAMNCDFSFGKLGSLASLARQRNSVRGHSSRSEGNYLQGAAATVSLARGLDLTAFASYRDIDGTLNADSSSISTIRTDGYHRTESEMARKHNTHQTLAGGNLTFRKNGFTLGATAHYTSLSRSLQPNTTQAFRQYYPQGRSFWNASVDYGYRSSRFSVRGETATGNCQAIATLNTATLNATDNLTLTAIQRFYSYKYYSLFARSFSDGGRIQNENGIYLGAYWQPTRRLSVMAYTDYARFAWPKYQISEASSSWDNLVAATLQLGQTTLSGRYRLRLRETDNADKTALIGKTEHRARLRADYPVGAVSLRTQVDFAHCTTEASSTGYMVSQGATYELGQWRFDLSAGYFDTDDYQSRIYIYERGLLYQFSFPMFSGRGIRYAASVRSQLTKSLMLMAKLGTTNYFDRSQIGTGLQTIDRSSQTDLEMQLRWKF